MSNILPDYRINAHTMSLIPARHIDYDTIAIETTTRKYIKKTPYQLMQRACLEHYSTYEGRRQAVMYHVRIKQKVPIPIHPKQNLIAIPTHSPERFECQWIFYNHIQTIIPQQEEFNTKKSPTSTVIFHNGEKLHLGVSLHTMETQLQRAGMCAGVMC